MLKVSSETDQISVAKLHEAGQEHVLRWWDQLTAENQRKLLDQLRRIDFQLLKRLVNHLVKGFSDGGRRVGLLEPAAAIPLPVTEEDRQARRRHAGLGIEHLRRGEVALFTAAGGSDLSGTLPLGPVSGKSLFELHAEKVRAASRRHRTTLPWVVMTSPEHRDRLSRFFAEHSYFSLPKTHVLIAAQPALPVVDRRGKLLMSSKGEIALSPNGHGGSLGLLESGPLREALEERRVRHILYFQVDNPLVRIPDPGFIGYHLAEGSEISLKAVRRVSSEERVGVFCRVHRRMAVVEHTELPEEDRESRNEHGELLYSLANIGVHMISLAFVDRLRDSGIELPYHVTSMSTPYLDRRGSTVVPKTENGLKFESFLFDAIPHARKSLVLEAERSEEFLAVRNGTGPDPVEATRRELSNAYAGWLEAVGVKVPRDAEGNVQGRVEISPLFALDPQELRERIGPDLEFHDPLYLE